MKKVYPFLFLCLLSFGCSKDFLKDYNDRIEGSWRLVDVDRRGIGGNTGRLIFQDGTFTFSPGGSLHYVNGAGVVYDGNWDIRKVWRRDRCDTDETGYYNCDDRRVRMLSVVAVDFATQEIKSENFDEMLFTGTDRFKAYIYSGAHTYIFHFRRQ